MRSGDSLETRLREYLAEGLRYEARPGMEARILERVSRHRTRWIPQMMAAAAVIVLAVGTGMLFHELRAQRTSLPSVSPSPSAAPTATPSGSPSPLTAPVTLRMINGSAGWAMASSQNRVLHTADGGAHWADVTPVGAKPGDWWPYFLDANTAWFASAVTGVGNQDFAISIYRTTNAGRSWEQVGALNPTDARPASLNFIDDRRGWLMLQVGTTDYSVGGPYTDAVAFYGTNDGGLSWTKLSETDDTGAAGHLPLGCAKYVPVFATASNGWLTGTCGRNGGLFFVRTRDGGRTWLDGGLALPAEFGGTCDCAVENLNFSSPQNGTLFLSGAGADGQAHFLAYVTRDGGASWRRSGSLTGRSPASVDFLTADEGWFLDGKSNILYHTSDGGQQWLPVGTIPSVQGVMGLQFVDSQHGWALGSEQRGESILVTTDGGRSWTAQLQP